MKTIELYPTTHSPTKVRIDECGNGPTPLLIIGLASLFKKPGVLPQAFMTWFHCYFFDHIQVIARPKPVAQLTLEDLVDEIETTRAALQLEKMIIFAHSSIGVIAHAYAKRYPQYLSAIIMVGTAPRWDQIKKDKMQEYFIMNASRERKEQYARDQASLQALLNQQNTRSGSFIFSYNARNTKLWSDYKQNHEELWEAIYPDEPLVDHLFTNLLPPYQFRSSPVPTFLALGLHDYQIPFVLWTDKHAGYTEENSYDNIHIHLFEESGHYAMTEQPELFCSYLKKFMLHINITLTGCDTSVQTIDSNPPDKLAP